jgi:hypothetical protein
MMVDFHHGPPPDRLGPIPRHCHQLRMAFPKNIVTVSVYSVSVRHLMTSALWMVGNTDRFLCSYGCSDWCRCLQGVSTVGEEQHNINSKKMEVRYGIVMNPVVAFCGIKEDQNRPGWRASIAKRLYRNEISRQHLIIKTKHPVPPRIPVSLVLFNFGQKNHKLQLYRTTSNCSFSFPNYHRKMTNSHYFFKLAIGLCHAILAAS